MVKSNSEFSVSLVDILYVMKITSGNKDNLSRFDSKCVMSSIWTKDCHESSASQTVAKFSGIWVPVRLSYTSLLQLQRVNCHAFQYREIISISHTSSTATTNSLW